MHLTMQQAIDAKAAAEGRAHDEAVARSAAEQREQVRFQLVKILLYVIRLLDKLQLLKAFWRSHASFTSSVDVTHCPWCLMFYDECHDKVLGNPAGAAEGHVGTQAEITARRGCLHCG